MRLISSCMRRLFAGCVSDCRSLINGGNTRCMLLFYTSDLHGFRCRLTQDDRPVVSPNSGNCGNNKKPFSRLLRTVYCDSEVCWKTQRTLHEEDTRCPGLIRQGRRGQSALGPEGRFSTRQPRPRSSLRARAGEPGRLFFCRCPSSMPSVSAQWCVFPYPQWSSAKA